MKQLNYPPFLALREIEAAIRSEQNTRTPNGWWLMQLKKLRLAAKDRLHCLVRDRRQGAA